MASEQLNISKVKKENKVPDEEVDNSLAKGIIWYYQLVGAEPPNPKLIRDIQSQLSASFPQANDFELNTMVVNELRFTYGYSLPNEDRADKLLLKAFLRKRKMFNG